MKRIEQGFDTLFSTIGAVIMSFIRHLAKFIVPVPPAWYWGNIISQSSDNLYVGIFAAVVLEIGGMLSAHYAIAYHGTAKGKLAAGLTAVYLVIGIGVMWLMESSTNDEKIVITAVFFIAGMVYVLSAMSELENQEMAAIEGDRSWQREQEARDRELKRRLEIANARLKHEERLARIEAKALAYSTPQNSQNSQSTSVAATPYECACGKVYDKPQSYSAHTRHCLAHKQQMHLNGATS